jgi:hypothetical protein
VRENARWSPDEDQLLLSLVQHTHSLSDSTWGELAVFFPGKTWVHLSDRWSTALNPTLVKGCWTREEDEAIIQHVLENGTTSWVSLAKFLPGRLGKQCRERWINHLDPSNNRRSWTAKEDETLAELHEIFGNSWVKIAGIMQGWSDNYLKNRWNTMERKKRRPPRSPHGIRRPAPENVPRPHLEESTLPDLVTESISPVSISPCDESTLPDPIPVSPHCRAPYAVEQRVDTSPLLPVAAWSLGSSPRHPNPPSSDVIWMSSRQTLFSPQIHGAHDAASLLRVLESAGETQVVIRFTTLND